MSQTTHALRSYSYLGPAGTFTEMALRQVAEAQGQQWRPVSNVGEALNDVVTGVSHAAMVAIENSVDGGVTAAQDALATMPGLQIIGEYLVPVSFSLVARPGASFEMAHESGTASVGDVQAGAAQTNTAQADTARTIAAHPVAYGQCRMRLGELSPQHQHVPAASNVQAVVDLLDGKPGIDAAVAPLGIETQYDVEVLAEGIADNPEAVTRFVLVGRTAPIGEPSGADKTSLIVELPDDRPGALLELLEQFATRGVNLTQIGSRPIGDRMGRYRFVIDAEGHIRDERVADALLGVKRHSPKVVFLGSYPRADHLAANIREVHDDERFREARDWLQAVIGGRPR